MAHEAGPLLTFAGVALTAVATIAVAIITTWRGRKLGKTDEEFSPADHGEHAHTRQLLLVALKEINLNTQEINRRLDALLLARGIQREQEQLARSAERISERLSPEEP